MDIRKRINARKIVLSYFYQHCFFSALQKKPLVEPKASSEASGPVSELWEVASSETVLPSEQKSDFLDADFLKVVAQKKEAEAHRDELVQAKINEYASHYAIEEDFDYILRHFFDQWSVEEVEVDYVLQVGNALTRYQAELIEKVNHYAQSFWYQQMDPMDQVLLLLGYCEYKVLQTPKEVIINEMIELAKRYSDDGAPKLINGLLNAIFQEN